MIIIFNNDEDIHYVVTLPAVANIQPPLVQGANPQQSAINLKNWLDAMAARHAGEECLVMWDLNGGRQEGLYHNMLQHHHASFIGEISSFRAWASQCTTQNTFAGRFYTIESSGTGNCTIIPLHIGPFE